MAIVLELARCPRSIGGPDGRRLDGGEILRIWAMNLGEEFLRTDSSAGAMARRSWLGCLQVVTRLVEFHGGRVGGARVDVPEAVPASSNVVDARNRLVKTEEIRSRN